MIHRANQRHWRFPVKVAIMLGVLSIVASLSSPLTLSQTADCADEISARVAQIMKSRTNGILGIYLKEVGGRVLAACNENAVFEPASTIKVLFHLHALLQVQAGSVIRSNVVTLNTPIPWFSGYNQSNGSSCPADSSPRRSPLSDVLREMMWNSDNRHTQAIAAYFGRGNINATAKAIGMDRTFVNHRLGCLFGDGAVDRPNQLTLYNAGLLYEQVADGTLLDEVHRKDFYELMAGKEYDFTGVWSEIQNMVEQDAPASMTGQEKQIFLQQVDTRYKAGGYTFCTPSCRYYLSIAGWIQVPTCSGSSVTLHNYVFGWFIHQSTNADGASDAFNLAKAELLREPISEALASCA